MATTAKTKAVQTKTIETKADVKDDTIRAEDVRETTSNVATKVAEGAREFMRRSALTAKERSDTAYETAEKFNDNVETAMNRAVSGYVALLDGVAKAAHEDVTRALTTVEKLAGARSVSEAVSIQTAYVRENTTANIERLRGAYGVTRDMVADGASTVRERVSSAMPKAA